VLGDLQRRHHRQIDHLDPALDPAIREVLATAGTLLGRMIHPPVRPLQLQTSPIVLRCPLPTGCLLALGRGWLALWYWIRSWGQRDPTQAGILLLEPCHLLPQQGILLGESS
jgi:hypothetical protein